MRYAVYFTPAPTSGLAAFGSAVLGYDATTGQAAVRTGCLADIAQELDAVVRAPRPYGFHATLKAPMVLRSGVAEADLVAAVTRLAASRPAVRLGRLELASLDGFLALVPAEPCPAVDMLAAECVATLDPLRAPMETSDRERRLRQGLSPRQAALFERWGYPYVFDEFRFHMTLTGPLPEPERKAWLRRLQDAFSGLSRDEVVVDALSVLQQKERSAPFRLVERIPLVA